MSTETLMDLYKVNTFARLRIAFYLSYLKIRIIFYKVCYVCHFVPQYQDLLSKDQAIVLLKHLRKMLSYAIISVLNNF